VAQRYAELPVRERVNFLEHRVASGETLSQIGERYRVSVSLIQAANPGIRARALRIGARLKIPVSAAARGLSGGSARRAAPSRAAQPAPILAGATHRVRPGETLWLLSRRFGVTVAELRRWNGLAVGDVLLSGQRLRIAPPVNDDGGSR
jgi:membrane-bound lytic murein transglycosylase D